MNKVNGAIAIAGLFISGVLVFLIFQGVHLKERRMIKWSAVESPQKAGEKVAQFLFPLFESKERVQLQGDSSFAQTFFSGLKIKALQNSKHVMFEDEVSKASNASNASNAFLIQVVPLQKSDQEACVQQDRQACLMFKVHKKFLKRPRDPQSFWINMYRLSENKALLFYKSPE